MSWHCFIHHTYATETLIALPFLIMRSSHEHATLVRRYFRSYGVRVTNVWRIEAATNTWRFFNMFEIIVTPFRTLANEAIVQLISYDSFRCCDVDVAYRAIRDTPYVRKPIRKGVRALLTTARHGDDINWLYFLTLLLSLEWFLFKD